ncbi:MAG: hypothetical protein A2Z47_03295 [Thermodesulfovibrio sp. RBG_19FT_COMBO_42_12]|nr:MAG: hypothetical protein A2Z47_03295 [Thermodesulfovibrio sp. RBG_19FT_COMBO_42_12]
MMFGDLATLNGLKRNKHVLKYIIWDIKPKQLMEPRHRITEEGKQVSKIISGYLFYIDKMAGKKPTLFLMCHTTGGYAETCAMINEIPDELIVEAIVENKDKEFFGMYPINKKVEGWLKKELGIQE